MSSGRFTRTVYESDTNEIHPIRLQPETVAATIGGAANAAPTGAATSDISADVSRGARELGLRPRFISGTWEEGGAPAGYDERTPVRIPILTQSLFDAASVNGTGTYLGSTFTIVSKTPESRR